MSYCSTAGIAVLKESGSTFETRVQDGAGRVQPTNGSQLEGKIYFAIPYPPKASTAQNLHINFASTNTSIISTTVYYDGDERFGKDVRKTSSFVQPLRATAASLTTEKEGICVALTVKFNGISSSIEIFSVGISFG
ncbi:hypothetical protein K440DRAFT_615317 [Wilcoxina mikolae CBS 423.85]|nr:hypothetical protein K440DRAFT_615317 [Wilcoxina mikolae CBS 423.85]